VETARLESCEVCGALFVVCEPCGFNWRYCEVCGPPIREVSVRRARKKYRRSAEGRAQHRDEQQRRRDRQRGGVGDQLVQAPGPGASVAVMKVAEPPSHREAPSSRRVGLARWRVVVRAELAEAAFRLRRARTVMACASCGRRGRVVEVVVKGESPWQAAARRERHRRRDDDGS